MDSEVRNPICYTLVDFEKIKNSNYIFNLEESAINVINLLAEKVGAPSYVKTPNFKTEKKPFGKNLVKKKKPKNNEISDEDWEAIRNFQTTEIKEAEGINKITNDIRIEINKFTQSNYNLQINLIFELIDKITGSDLFKDNDKLFVSKLIFDVACSNKFYSELYAKFISELYYKYDWLATNFNNLIKEKNIEYLKFEIIDASQDYEKFCQINKINENRRAFSEFCINIMKLKILSIDEIFNILNNYKELFKENLNNPESGINEQIAENITILVCGIRNLTDNKDEIEDIFQFISNITKYSISDYKGLNNKIIFKFLDILDNN